MRTPLRPFWQTFLYDLLLLLALAAGAWLRLTGLNWDQFLHLHPDERFLTMVESAIHLPGDPALQAMPAPASGFQAWRASYPAAFPDCASWGAYFNTACSPLNPANVGYTFYVYGTLPLFIVRYVADWTGQAGYDQVHLVGRALSTLADLLTILLLYLAISRRYGQKVAALAAALAAGSVLLIQQSHFFTVDTFTNLFMFGGVYFAVRVQDAAAGWEPPRRAGDFLRHPLFTLSLFFGLFLGMAAASKINAILMAVLLPGAFLVARLGRGQREPAEVEREFWWACAYLTVGALATLLAFRVFQPYAFRGPGFFGLTPNPLWLQNLRDLRAQTGGDVDFPPALQWARRPIWFAWQNQILWGLGLPLGLTAWAGFFWMGWRILRGEWRPHLLLWAWTGLYSLWQGLVWNRTMRYQLPVYPLLAMMAAWLILQVWNSGWRPLRRIHLTRALAALLLVVVLTGTFAWAWAFVEIYRTPFTRLAASQWIYQNVPGPANLRIRQADDSTVSQPLAMPYGFALSAGVTSTHGFSALYTGTLEEVYFPHIADEQFNGTQTLTVELVTGLGGPEERVLAVGSVGGFFLPQDDPRGPAYRVRLSHAASLAAGQLYWLRLSTSGGRLVFRGSAPVNESSWDDGLPVRLPGLDAYGGIYEGGLTFEMYWDDNEDKRARFYDLLDRGDYIFISSNRQWATTTRLPERYPLTSAYYRALIGCPPERDVIWCYNVAQPGMFEGQLGFELAAVFESYPTLGPWRFNDQFAEEAFSVYDHPKVLIFRKTEAYDPATVRSILGAVDLTHVVHLIPGRAASYPGDLMLPPERLAVQQAGGTWSELFDRDAWWNRRPAPGLLLWYLTLAALGLVTYPLVRLALPGLSDRGYPLARLTGLLLLAYIPWLLASFGVPHTRLLIGATSAVIALAGLALGWLQRHELAQEWRTRRTYFLMIEGLFLAFFLFDLAIRLGNPDLWHPWKGGERPMDFSYLNAVIKSTTFPPYDPWFAGGYINYYYWGFVLVGTPIKLLGIVPSVAYNFVLPTLFALVALGAFSLGWNLLAPQARSGSHKFLAGLSAALGMVVLGNLGTIRMLGQAMQKLVASADEIAAANVFQKTVWLAQGFVKVLTGASLPLARGDWYWLPSRVIPAPGEVEPITEFPFFTFLYSDLHAHMIALPLALLALAWVISLLLARGKWRSPGAAALGFVLGGLALGALRPTNTWDVYTYLPLAVIAVMYVRLRHAGGLSPQRRLLAAFGSAILLAGLALLLYQPYAQWYGQGYNKIALWTGTHTPLSSYFFHWGLFLFVIVSWLAWETREWMAATPVSALGRLRRWQPLIEAGAVLFGAALLTLAFLKVRIGWVALPIAAWSLLLILRPGQDDLKRGVLFFIGTAMTVTLAVEVVVLVGDISRMNTVFKFYLQAWTLLAVSAAAALGWLLPDFPRWTPNWRAFWQGVFILLVTGAALYTLTATLDKVKDRMTDEAPRTLDSMAYMPYATYYDQNTALRLDEDYRAILWLQENVSGSPVIVEANTVEYRWGSRMTIYTGLPGVVGWNWHQRQQRALTPSTWVSDRVLEIELFYQTTDIRAAQAFLQKYGVRYIIVGQLERAYYPGDGLLKFEQFDGRLWRQVYRDGQTAIYEVLP